MANYVYILKCKDNTLYSGVTKNPYSRLKAHAAGKGARYTRSHGAEDFVAIWWAPSYGAALKLEYRLKTLSRSQKEVIVFNKTSSFEGLGDYVFLGGESYAEKLEIANKYLKQDKVQYVDISEALDLGLGIVEKATEKGVLVYLPTCKDYFIATDDLQTLTDFSAFLCEWDTVVTHRSFEREYLKEKYDLTSFGYCYNVAYLKKTPPETDGSITIAPLKSEHAKIVNETYKLFDASEEVKDLISKGLMLGVFEGDTLTGFAGFHAQGALGMLEVLPEYRRRGYGEALSKAMISLAMSKGRIPFAQIFSDNVPSIKMQEKLGFSFSAPTICWLSKK